MTRTQECPISTCKVRPSLVSKVPPTSYAPQIPDCFDPRKSACEDYCLLKVAAGRDLRSGESGRCQQLASCASPEATL